MMSAYNPFVHFFKQAIQILWEEAEHQNLYVRLTYKAHNDPCWYNLPTSDELALTLPGDGTPEADSRDIILCQKGGGLRRISQYHSHTLHSTMCYSSRGENWVGTGTFLSKMHSTQLQLHITHINPPRSTADLQPHMTQINPPRLSPKFTTMPIISFQGMRSTVVSNVVANFSKNMF